MISELLGSISSIAPMAKALLELRDDAKRMAVYIELMNKIIAAQTCAATIQSENSLLKEEAVQLKEQARKLKEQFDDSKSYKLHELPSGAFVFRYQPTDDDMTPAHYTCAHCWKATRKHIPMQPVDSSMGRTLTCQSCKAELPDQHNPR